MPAGGPAGTERRQRAAAAVRRRHRSGAEGRRRSSCTGRRSTATRSRCRSHRRSATRPPPDRGPAPATPAATSPITCEDAPAIVFFLQPIIPWAPADDEGPMDIGRLDASVYPAVQNFCVAARSLGIGTALTTVIRIHAAETLEVLGVPANDEDRPGSRSPRASRSADPPATSASRHASRRPRSPTGTRTATAAATDLIRQLSHGV